MSNMATFMRAKLRSEKLAFYLNLQNRQLSEATQENGDRPSKAMDQQRHQALQGK